MNVIFSSLISKLQSNKIVDPHVAKMQAVEPAEKPEVQLGSGTIVDNRWELTKKLGEGAFGAVYECIDTKKKVKCGMALKIESRSAEDQVLKIEVAVLRAMQSCKCTCRLVDAGRTEDFNFMIMTLLGPSLDVLKKAAIKQKFTPSTAFRVALLCLEAVHDMHQCGWLHRDVKPSNFAIGHNDKTKRIMYIFDFGLARNYWTNENTLRPQRPIVGFRGTMRYCSIHAHLKKDLGRQDDLISLMYTLVEMIKGILPWKQFDDEDDVFDSKQKEARSIFSGLSNANKLVQYFTYIHTLRYEDKPRYSMLEEILLETIYAKNYHLQPFDWDADDEENIHIGFIPEPKTRKITSRSM